MEPIKKTRKFPKKGVANSKPKIRLEWSPSYKVKWYLYEIVMII